MKADQILFLNLQKYNNYSTSLKNMLAEIDMHEIKH